MEEIARERIVKLKKALEDSIAEYLYYEERIEKLTMEINELEEREVE